jgi:hypothetical protein
LLSESPRRHALSVPPNPSPSPERRIDEADLPDVVEEAAHLAAARGKTLDRAHVGEVLKEVDLPADLVDEAHDRVLEKRQNERAAKRKRTLLVVLGVGGLLAIGAVAAGAMTMRSEQAALAQSLVGQSARLSVGAKGADASAFRAADRPDIYFTVTLAGAPTGQSLDVRCDIRDPAGTVARQITYTTKTITTPVWDTHCHYALPSSASPGDWSIEMSALGKSIRRERFTVE